MYRINQWLLNMKQIRSLYTLIIFLSFTCFSSAFAQSHLLDEGISWELAVQRKEAISNLHYALEFSIPENREEAVEGKETVFFDVKEPVDVILDFNESADKVHSVSYRKNPYSDGKVRSVSYRKNPDSDGKVKECEWTFVNGHIVIPKKYIRTGKNAIVIDFAAGNQGLNRRDGYVYTLFVPDRAHTVFPCFDQPNMKAVFNLTLEVPKSWSVAQNGNKMTAVDDGSMKKGGQTPAGKEGYKKLCFEIDTPIPTYLFAFAAGEFKYQKYEEDGYKIGAYYRETDSLRIAQLPDIMHQVIFSLKWQEAFTGLKYPFPKYDLVILPGFQFGGMEHVGATFYNDNTLFLPPNPTPDEELRRTELISHETSHMWFGDAVTMNWFDDVWTKEVFANYFAAEITEPLFPNIDHELNWLRTYQGAAISQDRTEGRTSIRQPLSNMRYAGLIYNNIIYNKAPVMMRKMVKLMGKEAFQRGIQKYVAKYKYDNATWDDLIALLDAETTVDLRTFSREWVDTPMWPQRRAASYADAYDIDYYGYTALTPAQTDSLLVHFPTNGAQSMAAMMTLYENYLNRTIAAKPFISMMLRMAESSDPLTCSTAIKYLGEPLREMQLKGTADEVAQCESTIYTLTTSHPLPSVRTQALRLLISRAVSSSVVDSLYTLWQQNDSPLLSINDYMTLACELALRMPDRAGSILSTQRQRITNPDRVAQFDFISRAVNPSASERDSLFESLRQADNRRIEPWTRSVLYYLNHPLRDRESVRYIRPALELLPEIQRTGDIFFPEDWVSNLLAGHRLPEAYQAVQEYLNAHPDLLPLLRNKVLQAAYLLKRCN